MFPSPLPKAKTANPYETWSEACLKMEQRERLEADTPVKSSTFGPEMKLLYLEGVIELVEIYFFYFRGRVYGRR
jgi:hypothetical protein